MRLLAFPLCVFLNVMLFGMCGYMYLLWLQYWHRLWTQKQQDPEYQMSDFRRNEMIVEYYDEADMPPTVPTRTKKEKESPLIYFHRNMYPGKVTDVRLNMFRTKIVTKLRQALITESNNMNVRIDNPYGVPTWNQQKPNNQDLLCDLYSRMKVVKTLNKTDVSAPIRNFLPENALFPQINAYNSCVIVSSAGSLAQSNLGQFIDGNDFVLRFNNAPIAGYEKDVGAKTTLRILNSQILANSQFNFLNSSLYQDINLLMWDPSNYTTILQQWIENPEHNFIEPYIEFRRKYPKSNFHILHPSVLWLLWDFIQNHTSLNIKKNPPSSGFLGIVLLLPYCSTVNVVEYIPTRRSTQRCHYYSHKMDPLCTYGVWHPLAAEKLISLSMNNASDETVFYNGYISIPGYNKLSCS